MECCPSSSTVGMGVIKAMTIEQSKRNALSGLLFGIQSSQLTRSSLLPLLLGGLTIISGLPATLILGGCANALPGDTPTSQLLALESQPVESGRLLPPVPSPNVSSPTSSNQSFLVYVSGDSPSLLAQVRQVEPGAFIRSHNGHRVIQTGSFTNQEYAHEQIITLRSRGVTAQIAISQEARQPHLSGQKLLRAGNTLDVRYSGKAPQIIQMGETHDLTLTLAESVLNRAGQVVLPAGSLIRGRIVPLPRGSEFVASSIQVDGAVYPLNARSVPLGDVKAPRQISVPATATNAAMRAGGMVLGQVLDQQQATVPQVLRRAVGVGVGNPTARATVIEPNAVITLQLTSDF